MHFLQNCLNPLAVLMIFVATTCLVGYTVPGYRGRDAVGFYWIIWLIVGILALVAWVILVAS